MSNPLQPYTSEIVTRMINMEHAESRAWFRAIREYIERQAGGAVKSIHDYVTAPAPVSGEDGREEVLRGVVRALRANEIRSLSTLSDES